MIMNTNINENKYNKIITHKDIVKLNWRSMMGASACNFERLTNVPFCFIVGPTLKKIYGDDKDAFSKALQRHLVYYATTPQVYSYMGGLMVAMEEQNKLDPDFDEHSINAVKSALMGPLSGIGDALFVSTIRVIGASVAISLAQTGNAIAPLVYFLIFNIPNNIFRFYGGQVGYEMGTGLLTKLQESGLMDKVMSAASILGLMVIGGMSYTSIGVNLALAWGPEGYQTNIMDVINGIFPGLLSLAVVFLFYWMRKKNVSTVIMLVGTIIVVCILTAMGIM
jgi:fructoselysine and glucoselysine-specific PTS system IID component